MDAKRVTAIAIACLLVGVLVGYLLWGLRSGQLASELGEARTRLAETQRMEERQGQAEAELKEADAKLKKLTEDLEFERQRRAKLEVLLSKGRK